jgi:hypothetical protein
MGMKEPQYPKLVSRQLLIESMETKAPSFFKVVPRKKQNQ